MRRLILAGAICLSAFVLTAATDYTPLNVKTGLWETTSTTTVNGALGVDPEMMSQLTPEQRAEYEAAMKVLGNGKPKTTTYKNCVTRKDLTENPFDDKSRKEGVNCQDTVIRSTGSDLEVKESCKEETATADVHITFHASSPEHTTGTGTIVAVMAGRTMKSDIKMESKWLGATCPAGMK